MLRNIFPLVCSDIQGKKWIAVFQEFLLNIIPTQMFSVTKEFFQGLTFENVFLEKNKQKAENRMGKVSQRNSF